MFLRNAFRFWFRPVLGFNIDPGTAILASGGLNFLGGLFGSSAKKKALKQQNELTRQQLAMERGRRDKLLGFAGDAVSRATQRLPGWNNLVEGSQRTFANLSPAFESGLGFVKDLASGKQYRDRLEQYGQVESGLYGVGRAGAEAARAGFTDEAQRQEMEYGRRYGGGGFAESSNLARSRVKAEEGSNLAIANAVLQAAQGRRDLFDDNLSKQAMLPGMMPQLVNLSQMFELGPQNLAFSTDLENLGKAYNTAGAMQSPYALYAGLPQTNYKLSGEGVSVMGDALGNAAQGFADFGTYKLGEQRNDMLENYYKSLALNQGTVLPATGGAYAPLDAA